MGDIVSRFAARLHNLRSEKGMTQEELAARSGLHSRYISSLERGKQTPKLTALEALAKGLDVELPVLVDFPSGSNKTDRQKEELALLNRVLQNKDFMTVRKARHMVELLLKK